MGSAVAEGGGSAMETVTSALTTGITTIAGDAMGAIGAVIPVALPVLGALLVVGIGIKVFKKVTGRNG